MKIKKKKRLIILIGICLVIVVCAFALLNKKTEIKYAVKNINRMMESEKSIIQTWKISASNSDNVTATLYEDGTFVIDGSGKMTDYQDNSVGAVSYKNRPYYTYLDQITNVIIQGNVTNIGRAAFYNSTNLTNLTIKSNLENIGLSAFTNCTNLQQIEFQGGLTTIDARSFSFCTSLNGIRIPNGVVSIKDGAFDGCENLTEIHIPASVTNIGVGAFSICPNLNKIEVDSNNKIFDSRNNCNAIIDTQKNSLVLACLTTQIPNNITTIDKEAFSGCNIESIEIPNNIISINTGAFAYCKNLKNIVIPESVGIIGAETFRGCSSLQEVKIPENVTMMTIGARMFQGCSSLTTVNIPKSITSIEIQAFSGCTNLKKIEILKNVTQINSYAFENCRSLRIYGESGSVAQQYAQENNIPFTVIVDDKNAPTISNVIGNPTTWTNQNVTLTVEATDIESGIAIENAYSFDDGETWQTENNKTYTKNTSGIIVKVKDSTGNIATYEQTINIDKIDKTIPTIEINPNGASTSKSKIVTITVADNGGSGLSSNNSYQYQLGTSNTEEPTGTWKNYTSGTEFTIGEELTGEYYLWIKAITDNAGNKSTETEYMVSDKFIFDNTKKELNISSEIYKIDEDNFISNILPKTDVTSLLQNINCSYEMEVYDKDNQEITEDTLIATGMKIIANGAEYILVVKGDTNGSGTVDLNDAIRVLQHRAGGKNPQLTGAYLKAAQLTKSGNVTLNDVIKIMRYKATNGEETL